MGRNLVLFGLDHKSTSHFDTTYRGFSARSLILTRFWMGMETELLFYTLQARVGWPTRSKRVVWKSKSQIGEILISCEFWSNNQDNQGCIFVAHKGEQSSVGRSHWCCPCYPCFSVPWNQYLLQARKTLMCGRLFCWTRLHHLTKAATKGAAVLDGSNSGGEVHHGGGMTSH